MKEGEKELMEENAITDRIGQRSAESVLLRVVRQGVWTDQRFRGA